MSETIPKIRPEGKRLLVQLNPIKATARKIVRDDGSETELHLADDHPEETRFGIVLATGEEVDTKYRVGSRILVSFLAGIVLHLPGEGVVNDTIRMITQMEILAFIEE